MHIATRLSSSLIVLGSLLVSCGGKDRTASAPAVAAIPVTVATAAGNLGNSIHLSGTINASQTTAISTRLMGYISQLKVKAGDHVRKGQLLAVINSQDILAKKGQTEAAIAQAEAALASAQKDLDRFTTLYKQQSATAKELENAELQYRVAKSGLEAARQMKNEVTANLGYSNVYAPFDGVITQQMVESGSMANPGAPLLMLEQTGRLEVSAAVPEYLIGNIKIGDNATVTIDAAGKTINAKIRELIPSSRFTGGQYLVKIPIPADNTSGLYAGMYTSVELAAPATTVQQPETDAVLVPAAALTRKDEMAGIYTVSSQHTALLRWLRLGRSYGNQVEVLSGLSKNEPFIVSADGKLYNGVPVTISNK